VVAYFIKSQCWGKSLNRFSIKIQNPHAKSDFEIKIQNHASKRIANEDINDTEF